MNEAETCRKEVRPRLEASGWDTTPHLYNEQVRFTDGRIVVAGSRVLRRKGKPAGYASCPDHTEKAKMWDLFSVETVTGIQLTERSTMLPVAAVSGLYFAHPEARYFAVDLITRDQADSYAARKGMPRSEVERWLAPNLGL